MKAAEEAQGMAIETVLDKLNRHERHPEGTREEAEERTDNRHTLALVGELVQKNADLTQRVDELEAWLGEVADDMLNRTQKGLTMKTSEHITQSDDTIEIRGLSALVLPGIAEDEEYPDHLDLTIGTQFGEYHAHIMVRAGGEWQCSVREPSGRYLDDPETVYAGSIHEATALTLTLVLENSQRRLALGGARVHA